MFSWRQAVESLAQHSPKSSQDLTADEQQSRGSSDLGLRATLSSSQLAESALTNLKKTLATQRSGSPGPSRVTPSASSEGTGRQQTHRSTLEDRLRAKFAASDASNPSTSSGSSKGSPSPHYTAIPPLSPASTPLPDSPHPQSGDMRDPLDALSLNASSPPKLDAAGIQDNASVLSVSVSTEAVNIAQVMPLHNPLSPTSTPLPDSPRLSPVVDPVELSTALHITHADDSLSVTLDAQVEASVDDAKGTPSASLHEGSDHHALSDSASAEDEATIHTADEGYADVIRKEEASSTTPPAAEEITLRTELVHDLNLSEGDHASSGGPDSISESARHMGELEGASVLVASETVPASEPGYTARASLDAAPGSVEVASAGSEAKGEEADVEGLQKRLKLIEKRFSDVSTSFKRLQAEKMAADRILRELTPLESVQELDSLRDYLQNMNMKTEMAQDEIKRLSGKLTRQEERIEELRDIHRLESKSQSDQIEKLRSQVDEAEALLKASLNTNSQLEQELTQQKTGIEKLQADVGRANGTAKDEEEKRVKAVTLLKTVRQKLVKAEKERDDALKEMRTMKDQEREEKEKEAAEKLNLQREIERLTADKESALNSLKSQFEKEMNALKDKQERELLALRGQFEMEAMATKSSHARELESKSSRVSELQTTVRTLEGEKDEFFDQLQLRQAELESSRSRLETLESQTTEYQYQLHEAQERIALLSEELGDARREHESRALSTGPSAQEVTRLLSAAEVKYESRISDLRKRLSAVERERDEGEAEWSHKLSEKMRDLESLKAVLNSSAKSREEESESANSLREEIDALKTELQTYQARILELKAQVDRAAEVENNAHTEVGELNARIVAIQQLVEDGKAREAQLRTHNKTLREELRKVQSSAALLERQRNPGVGYWASRQESSPEMRSPRSSVSDLTTRDTPSRPGSPAVAKSDEEINVEYLRNIILQFLEHKEMRPHLVRILSTILRFTPQETRRLVSKV